MRTSLQAMLVAIAVVVGLAGCKTTEQKMIEAGMSPLTQAEATAHISGNTEVWTKGGGYYAPGGVLKVKWEGQDGSGTWEVRENGKVCYSVNIWGSGVDCHSYVNDNGTVKLVYKGNSRAAEIRSGDQLDSL